MQDELKALILENEVISFDMFDTLVIRAIDDTEGIYDIVGQKFNIKDFRRIRHDMQALRGLELQKEKGYPHANIDEIYEYMSKKFDIINSKEIMDYEIALEKKFLFQNKEMYDIYKFAIDNNKKVVITSDMYMDLSDIKEILNNAGYKNISHIFLSSKERKAKFNGKLYDYLIEELKVDKKKILHIGDNEKDDYNMAIFKGINAYLYNPKLLKNVKKSIPESIHNGIVRIIQKNNDDFWFNIGAKAGLLYYALYKNLENTNYKKIYFLSRDGYNLYNIFKRLNNDIEVEYVYTSRRSLLLASISKIDKNTLSVLPPFTFGQTVNEILNYLGMKQIFDINDLNAVGFKSFDDKIMTTNDIDRFKKLYPLKSDQVLEKCSEERKAAKKYFDSLNLEKNNLFFDCGWNGSSQYLLDNVFCELYPDIKNEFYYAGIFDNAKSRKQLSSKKYSAFMFDINYNQDIVYRVKDCIVLLEMFFGSPENSILKYDIKNKYIFDDLEKDLDYKNKILEGLLEYFKYANELYAELKCNIKAREAINPLISLIEQPSLDEAINIGNIENVDAFAKQKGVTKYIGKASYNDFCKNKNFEIYWKYGILKRTDIDPRVKRIVRKKYHLNNEKTQIKYNLYGIRNPLLSIIVYCDSSKNIYVYENGKLNKSESSYDRANSVLHVNEKLKRHSRVEIFEEINDEMFLVKSFNNNIIKRIFLSLINYCNKIFNKVFKYPKRILKKLYHIIKRLFVVFIKGIKYLWRQYHFIIPPKDIKKLYKKFMRRLIFGDSQMFVEPNNDVIYRRWLKYNSYKSKYKKLDYEPLISFVIPVYNVSGKLLSECLDSILNQTYRNIEICLADDASTNEETKLTLARYEKKDKRVKVIYKKENGHISRASNSALELAVGEYVAMMDNDDTIPEYAIYEMVKVLNSDKTIDMIYSDEDKLDMEGKRCIPHFKSDFAPDTLMSVNYFCHFTLLRTSILRDIGGWKVGYEGAQDWDLFLRFTEKANNIYHLPKILYHWRMTPGSTSKNLDNKDYASVATKKLLQDALIRRNTPGIVHLHDKVPYYWIEYKFKKEPLVSIIIPTKDYASTLEKCLESIYSKQSYKNYEVIIVDNKSVERETFELFDNYKKKYKNFKVVKADMEFNYSKINNIAVKKAKGEYILLLNNDTEVITNNWIGYMVGYAMQNHVGAVGAKLLFPDDTIQHGGVVLGMGGVAGHVFVNSQREDVGEFGRLCVPYNYSVVTAACLMVKKSKFLEVNGLTEELKVAYNDVDFCLKLQQKGYYNVMLPIVELYHYESKSRGMEDTPEKMKRFRSEEAYMYDHWKEWIENDPMYNPNLSRVLAFKLNNDKKE